MIDRAGRAARQAQLVEQAARELAAPAAVEDLAEVRGDGVGQAGQRHRRARVDHVGAEHARAAQRARGRGHAGRGIGRLVDAAEGTDPGQGAEQEHRVGEPVRRRIVGRARGRRRRGAIAQPRVDEALGVERARPAPELQAVGVEEVAAAAVDQEVAIVQVADHDPGGVERAQGGVEVGEGRDQGRQVGRGGAAVARLAEREHRRAGDLGHDVAQGRAAARGRAGQAGRRHHRARQAARELAELGLEVGQAGPRRGDPGRLTDHVGMVGALVQLERATVAEIVDLGLAAGAEQRQPGEVAARAVDHDRGHRWPQRTHTAVVSSSRSAARR
jgi:hypothetical protein